jgi:hypothetical protein
MATQIIKKAASAQPKIALGERIQFKYWVQLQNIGWGTEVEEGVIQKVNPVTVHVVDFKGNLWKVEKEDILRNIPNSKFLD